MNINSAAYRLLTLTHVLSFAAMLVEAVDPQRFDIALFLIQLGRLSGAAVIPAFLIWRNVSTLRQRQPLVPDALRMAAPWYYVLTIIAVWLQLVFLLALPAAATIARFLPLEDSMSTSLLLGNLAAVGFWYTVPTLFAMEVMCAYYRSRMQKDEAR